MSDEVGALEEHYLKPGEMYFGERPTVVSTVLGSCVSVTMFHPRLRIGAICHGLLPQCPGDGECVGDCLEGFRYVECSILRMARRFDGLGVRRVEIEVKVFGGADMLGSGGEGKTAITVGRQNIRKAQEILEREHFIIKASDTGGARGRKIRFDTHSGDVFLKRLKRQETGEGACDGTGHTSRE